MSVAMMKKGGRAWSDISKSCHWERERISSIYKQGLFSRNDRNGQNALKF